MRPPRGKLLAMLLLLGGAAIGFVLLGNWQLRRLDWKLALIEAAQERVDAPPVAAPGPDAWPDFSANELEYLRVRLRGHYLVDKQVLVHGPSMRGYGYWAMAPLQTRQGFIVLVNRGYIPPGVPGSPAYDKALPPTGDVVLVGLLRNSDPGGGLFRDNDPQAGIWYSRDVESIAGGLGLSPDRVAPYFVDAGADMQRGEYPVAGLTRVSFRNNHLGYAITWYLLALGCLLCAAIVIRHESPR